MPRESLKTKRTRAGTILNRLKQEFPQVKGALNFSSPFELLIATILSAQCTDERVNQVTPALFARAATPATMARLSVATIQGIIRPCGLSPQKAKAIKRLSELLLADHAGQVPETFQALEALPGVGHKTASVVMAQAFGLPTFPVDTHIHRLAQRWGLTRGRNVVETERDLKKVFPEQRWNDLHLQIIFYGREYCTARGCDGRVCEICRTCYPQRKHPKKIRKA